MKYKKTEIEFLGVIGLKERGECVGCNRDMVIKMIPMISHEKSIKLRKRELIIDTKNYMDLCKTCSDAWLIHGIGAKLHKLMNLNDILKYLRVNDNDRFTVLVVAIEHAGEGYYNQIKGVFI